jgi:hypothetical protein
MGRVTSNGVAPRMGDAGSPPGYISGFLPACAGSIPAARSALGKGWRWVGEMEEIAAAFAAAGQPDGFHRAAAEIYGRSPHDEHADEDGALERVLAALAGRNQRGGRPPP